MQATLDGSSVGTLGDWVCRRCRKRVAATNVVIMIDEVVDPPSGAVSPERTPVPAAREEEDVRALPGLKHPASAEVEIMDVDEKEERDELDPSPTPSSAPGPSDTGGSARATSSPPVKVSWVTIRDLFHERVTLPTSPLLDRPPAPAPPRVEPGETEETLCTRLIRDRCAEAWSASLEQGRRGWGRKVVAPRRRDQVGDEFVFGLGEWVRAQCVG
jgi:hypothetical protein